MRVVMSAGRRGRAVLWKDEDVTASETGVDPRAAVDPVSLSRAIEWGRWFTMRKLGPEAGPQVADRYLVSL